MSLTAKESGGGDIPVLNRGWYNAVCCRIIDLGTQEIEWQNQTKQLQKIVLGFLIEGEFVEIDGEKLPRVLNQEYTMSLHPKSRLRPQLENWRNKPFTEEELRGFDLKKLLGASAKVKVVLNDKGTWNNIDYIDPPEHKIQIPADFESGVFEFPASGEIVAPDWVPNYLKRKIEDSLEVQREKGMMSAGGYQGTPQTDAEDAGSSFDDADIPF